MAGCSDMKVGQVYTCADCGIELQVVKACKPEAAETGCGCHTGEQQECVISCCDKELTLKE
jgi:hypothetical protein